MEFRLSYTSRIALLTLVLLHVAQLSDGVKKLETPPRTELSHPCSRVISRQVRKQLEKEILRPASRAGHKQWPEGCPLDPVNDLYGEHEKQKQRKRGSSPGTTWTCGICARTFKSEHYLDLHMERNHMNVTPHGGTCLAHYCELFEVCHEQRYPRMVDRKKRVCDNVTMLTARRRCEDAMAKCFPLSGDVSRKLHAQFSKHWCQVLDCRIREEKWKEEIEDLMPLIVILILIVLVVFVVFSLMVCCVDSSDEIAQFLVESRLASIGMVRNFLKAREKARVAVGQVRTKGV